MVVSWLGTSFVTTTTQYMLGKGRGIIGCGLVNCNYINRYGGGSFSFSRLIKILTGSFSSEYDLKEVTDFFAENYAGSAVLAVEQAKEVIQGNILWTGSNLDTVRSWLEQNY